MRKIRIGLALVLAISMGQIEAVNAANVMTQASYSEDANSDDAPYSKSEAPGNIKKLKVSQSSNGTLTVTIDYWAVPDSHYFLMLRWCTYIDEYRHNVWTGEDLTMLCDVSDAQWNNYVIYFDPALSSKGSQIGLRKSFTGKSVTGKSKVQRIYTITGNLFKSTAIAGLQAAVSYSSTTVEKVTTSCRGTYSITCNTSSSNIFDVDEVLVELDSNYVAPVTTPKPTVSSKPTPKPSTSASSNSGQNVAPANSRTIQDYFNRIKGSYNTSSRQFQVECINDAPRDGYVSNLRVLLAISSNPYNTSPGTNWFPSKFFPAYSDKIKTWTGDTNGQTHLYIELDFKAVNNNPCGLIVSYVPKLSEIGEDVNNASFLVAGTTGYAVALSGYSRTALG